MSWFGRQVMTAEEVRRKSATTLPSRFQLGDSVKLWLENAQPPHNRLYGFLVAVEYSHSAVYYSLAVPTTDEDLFVVVSRVQGWLTPPHFTQPPPDGGLDEITPQVVTYLESMGEPTPERFDRPALTLVKPPKD